MPNIAITNYCNLKCPYCFADDFIQTEKHNITLQELQTIFDFLIKTPKDITRIGLIGGEPTLHPNFSTILKAVITFSKQQSLIKPNVFSNGILLGQYSFFFAQEASVLLNLNSPKVIGNEAWNKIEKTLKNLEYCQAFANNNVRFGINLYLNIPDWSYIFDVSENYNQKEIRCSIVAPTCQLKDINKYQYYNQNKELFLDFLSDAVQHDIDIKMDCNRIPLCYFSEKEKNFILKHTIDYETFCHPVIDISHDMKGISCFGVGIPVELNNFTNLNHLIRYFELKQIASLVEKNKTDNCINCKKIDTLECQGGCFSFAK